MTSKKETSRLDDNLISIKVYISIEYDENKINENISLNFRKYISIREMLKEIVDNFNSHFEKHKIKIKLKPEGLGYGLIEYKENSSEDKNKLHKHKIFEKRQKLIELNVNNFRLIYDPRDIMINFEKKGFTCFNCSII